MDRLSKILALLEKEAHAVLDRFEDPELMIGQAMRDAEAELDKARTTLIAAMAAREQLERSLHEAWALHLQWEARTLDAVAAGEELLAQGAMAFAGDYRLRHQRLQVELEQMDRDLPALRLSIQDRERQLATLHARREELVLRLRKVQVDQAYGKDTDTDEESPLSLYARMEAKLRQVISEGEQVEAMAEEALARKFDALKRAVPSQAVLDKLAALKRKLDGTDKEAT